MTRVTVTGSVVAILAGGTLQLSAAAFDASGVQFANPGTFAWSSSATSTATVDQTGKVSAISAGTATINADLSGVRGTLDIRVSQSLATRDTVFALSTSWSPAFVSIKVGESVSFVFTATEHNAIFSKFNVPGSPPDIGRVSNQLLVRTFNTKGKFPFECTLHNGMVGEVTVQ